jgi:hypothetical protein
MPRCAAPRRPRSYRVQWGRSLELEEFVMFNNGQTATQATSDGWEKAWWTFMNSILSKVIWVVSFFGAADERHSFSVLKQADGHRKRKAAKDV